MGDKILVLPNLFFDINQMDTETLRRLIKVWLRDGTLIEHTGRRRRTTTTTLLVGKEKFQPCQNTALHLHSLASIFYLALRVLI
jgi:hypothetical protein